MSYCKQIGKDKIIFVSSEDLLKPSNVVLSEDTNEEAGLILPNGQINWNCPCLGGMASGPCGYQFREAFTCFHNSKEELKGSDCVEKFHLMQECMTKYPNLYPKDDPIDDLEEDDKMANDKNNLSIESEEENQAAPSSAVSKA
jgi:mitochondrial intermembrane space import and assembly protein 40-B